SCQAPAEIKLRPCLYEPLPLKLLAYGHHLLSDRTVLFPDVSRACNGFPVKHVRTRIREPQNLVQFCGPEPMPVTSPPGHVEDQCLKLIFVKWHPTFSASSRLQ